MIFRALALALLIAASLSARPVKRYQVTGLVLTVDPAHSTVLVSHDPIPNYMDAMTMPYRVEDPRVLPNLKPGARIGFTLVVGKSSSHISDVHVLEYDSMERDPAQVRRLTILDEAMRAKAGSPAIVKIGEAVPDFSLIDQTNRSVTLSEFRGKVVAITFIYTRCPLPDYCIRLSNNFAQLQKRFHDRLNRDLVLLSITFDPEHDQPDVLKKYAEQWKAKAEDWHFLTGPLTPVKQVCGMFGMNFWADEGLMTHSLRTVVLDREGKLVANLEGNQYTAVQLGDLVGTVLKSQKAPAPCRSGLGNLSLRTATVREFSMGLRPTKGDKDVPVAHALCVPRSHSCERSEPVEKSVRRSANTARTSACATVLLLL